MYRGIATAARMPRMIVTMISSMSVKPLLFITFVLLRVITCDFVDNFLPLLLIMAKGMPSLTKK
tara:strand:- start:204 stop:395 length:192 start_codon:yes stop_codon:yes gene_type:complete